MSEYIKVKVSESERKFLEDMIRTGTATTLSGAIRSLAFSNQLPEDLSRKYFGIVADSYNEFCSLIHSFRSTSSLPDVDNTRLTLMESDIALMESQLEKLVSSCLSFQQKMRRRT